MASTQIFPGDSIELFVWTNLLPIIDEEEISCVCSEVFALSDLIEDFDLWACDCQPEGPPIASFYVENEGECGNQGISFVNTVTGGEGPTFDWSFGMDYEFGQSLEASPTVDVIVYGGGVASVPVTLTVIDDNGCTDSETEFIEILQTPNPGESFDVGNICTGNPNNVNQIIEIIPLPFGQGGIDTIISDWDFEAITDNDFSSID